MDSNLNILSLYYFVVLAKELHMTHAAKKLYITQQNLSQHIQKLEAHYGVELFVRKPKMALTIEGEQLYDTASKILSEEEDIVNKFSIISQKSIGRLRIGIPTYRANVFLPYVLPKFYEKWPNIHIDLIDQSSDKTEKMLFDNQLDLFIGIKYDSNPSLVITPLLDDKIYLAVTTELLEKYTPLSKAEAAKLQKQGTDMLPFKNMPFLLQKGTSRLRQTIDKCFREAKIQPRIFLEATASELLISLFPYHYGGIFLTQMRLNTMKKTSPSIFLFPLRSGKDYVQHRLVLAYHKDYELPPYAKDFINFFKEAIIHKEEILAD